MMDKQTLTEARNYNERVEQTFRAFNEFVEHGHVDLKQAALIRVFLENMRQVVRDALEHNAA